jgi:hypothetical protein
MAWKKLAEQGSEQNGFSLASDVVTTTACNDLAKMKHTL